MSTLTIKLDSQNHWVADGSQTVWNFEFSDGYINRTHVRAYQESNAPVPVRTELVIDPDTSFVGDYQLLLAPAVPAGYTLVIYRATPKDKPLVDFQDGGGVTELNLDTMARQSVMLAQESADFLGVTTTADLQDLAQSSLAAVGAAAASAANASGSASLAGTSAATATSAASAAAGSASAAATSAANAAAAASAAIVSAINVVKADLASTSDLAKGDALLGVKWSASGAVGTTQHQVNEDAPTAMMVISDALKPAIRALTSSSDLGAALSAYLTYCYNNNKEVTFPPGQYSISPITITCNGGRLDRGMKWSGAGKNVTRLVQSGAPTSQLIRIEGETPGSGVPTSIQMMMRDMSFVGVGKTCDGLVLDGTASIHLENVSFEAFNVSLDLRSTLIGTIQKCTMNGGTIGIRTRRNGTAAFCNALTFIGNEIKNNSQFGLDFGAANGIKLIANDLEENGVAASASAVTISVATPAVVSWGTHGLVAGDPVIFTTTGALPTGMTADYVYYVIATGLTAGTFQFSATLGGAAVATTVAGSGTHTATSPKTGAVVIRATCLDELGYGMFHFDGNWFEGNRGAVIRSEYMTAAFGLNLSLQNSHIAGAVGGEYSLVVGNARFVDIRNHFSVVGNDTVNISGQGLNIDSCMMINLKRPTNVTTSVTNSRFNGVTHFSGEQGNFTMTLTGCTTSPTAVVGYTIQGRTVTLNLAPITATSNTTAATLTGMPVQLWPSTNRTVLLAVTDNGAQKTSPAVIQTTGVIALTNNFDVFTASGTKGMGSGVTITYEI